MKICDEYGEAEESQFFCLQAVFHLLCHKEVETCKIFFSTFSRKSKEGGSFPFKFPLFNLAFFLLRAIEMKNQKTFFLLCHTYDVS